MICRRDRPGDGAPGRRGTGRSSAWRPARRPSQGRRGRIRGAGPSKRAHGRESIPGLGGHSRGLRVEDGRRTGVGVPGPGRGSGAGRPRCRRDAPILARGGRGARPGAGLSRGESRAMGPPPGPPWRPGERPATGARHGEDRDAQLLDLEGLADVALGVGAEDPDVEVAFRGRGSPGGRWPGGSSSGGSGSRPGANIAPSPAEA